MPPEYKATTYLRDSNGKTHRRRDSWMSQVKSLFSPSSSDRSGNSSPHILRESLVDLRLSSLQETSVETDIYLLNPFLRNTGHDRAIETNEADFLINPVSSNDLEPSLEYPSEHYNKFPPVRCYPIQRGRDWTCPTSSDDSPLGILQAGRKIIVRKDPERKIRFTDFACFLDAAWQGDLDEMIKMIEERGIHHDTCNADGVTALHCAAACSYYEMAEYLLRTGASINVADDHGWTPLHSAAYNNCHEMVELLLEYGANVEAVDEQGQTPISLPTDIDIIRRFGEIVTHKKTSEWVTALYDFNKELVENADGDELNFVRGDQLRILNRADPAWWLAELDGVTGYIPRQFVQ